MRGLCPEGLCQGVSVQEESQSRGSLSRGSLYREESPSRVVSVQGCLCPEGGVSVQGISVQRGDLCPGVVVWCVSVWESLSNGVSVWGSLSRWSLSRVGLCLGVSAQGVSVQGVSVHRVSVQEGVSVQGDLCPEGGISVQGVSVQEGLCPGTARK